MDNFIKIEIAPLSINQAYKGRRFRTKKYDKFEYKLKLLLPQKIKLPEQPYRILFKFGLSSKLSDWDNIIKAEQDVIAKKYKFNDRLIRGGIVDTEIVEKGKEYIAFKIIPYQPML